MGIPGNGSGYLDLFVFCQAGFDRLMLSLGGIRASAVTPCCPGQSISQGKDATDEVVAKALEGAEEQVRTCLRSGWLAD